MLSRADQIRCPTLEEDRAEDVLVDPRESVSGGDFDLFAHGQRISSARARSELRTLAKSYEVARRLIGARGDRSWLRNCDSLVRAHGGMTVDQCDNREGREREEREGMSGLSGKRGERKRKRERRSGEEREILLLEMGERKRR
ncbi:hypothetical protein TIFTF001_008761 [Ficus carica]|uniref:Uncharacterized protein n=1 Tax=Ficus carica TaxID=3494 RepID=A0AA88CYC3_FICCA|nr:hypothetical protein TIFTF001_008761 [Ficus carica]